MELFNKESLTLKAFNKSVNSPAIIAVRSNSVQFTPSAKFTAGMQANKYVHFLPIGDDDFGLIVNDNDNGFALTSIGGDTLQCGCTSFIRYFTFKKGINIAEGQVKFLIERTEEKYKTGETIYAIKPYNQ